MKEKGKRSSGDAPEQAVTAFEEAIAALTRAVELKQWPNGEAREMGITEPFMAGL